MSGDQQILKMEGFLTIRDYKTGEVLQEAKNAINYENMSEAMDLTITDIMAVGPDWLLTCHINNSDKHSDKSSDKGLR